MKTSYITIISIFQILFFGSVQAAVFHVPIQGDIDMGLPYFIERAVDQAEQLDAEAIVFDIDTFGGRVDAATRIKDAILGCDVPTIAFINRRAISAGALISLSCDYIFMTSGATIGAATAVDQSGEKTSEKVISYMREEMASTAEANQRDRSIAAAMVDDELEIPFVISSAGDTLTSDQIEGFRSGKLITLSTRYALEVGIADQEYETLDEVLQHLNTDRSAVVKMETTWSENLVRFLTSPVVAPLLMTLGFLGLLFEIKSPGFGFPGIAGLVCLILFFGATWLVGLADVFEIILFGVGIILVLLEIFVIPGFGIAGITGGGLMLFGLFKMLIGDYPTGDDMSNAISGLSIGILLGIIGGAILFPVIVRSKLYQKAIPIQKQDKESGYTISRGFEALIGQTGSAVTDLRPAGKINIGGTLYQGCSQGDYIEKGTAVRVSSIDENQLVVVADGDDSGEQIS